MLENLLTGVRRCGIIDLANQYSFSRFLLSVDVPNCIPSYRGTYIKAPVSGTNGYCIGWHLTDNRPDTEALVF